MSNPPEQVNTGRTDKRLTQNQLQGNKDKYRFLLAMSGVVISACISIAIIYSGYLMWQERANNNEIIIEFFELKIHSSHVGVISLLIAAVFCYLMYSMQIKSCLQSYDATDKTQIRSGTNWLVWLMLLAILIIIAYVYLPALIFSINDI